MKDKALPAPPAKSAALPAGYAGIHGGIVELLDTARQTAARSVNALMTASYWEIGRRIVEAEQQGKRRAGYGEQLMARLSADLTAQFGRGFSPDNLEHMRRFFAAYPWSVISETLSRKFTLTELAQVFPLPWSAYVRLLSVKDAHARQFYEAEALRGGWSVRQLDRQIGSQFYERTALSKDKAAMLVKGAAPKPEDSVTPGDAIKDPYALEFLDLKDEYSESDLEAALIRRLEDFLLELGEGFTFIGRQRRLRIDQTWYRVDYRSAVVSSQVAMPGHHRLEIGQLDPCGRGPDAHVLQLCQRALGLSRRESARGSDPLRRQGHSRHALARYALEGLPTKVMAANYRTVLPDAELLQKELEATRRLLESRTSNQLKKLPR